VQHLPVLLGAGFLAGVMNAVAGGGSFLSFPALLFAGVPAVAANASSTVALWPGSLTSLYGYRDRILGLRGVRLPVLLAVSVAGGLVGALLLLFTPEGAFNAIVPWLLLLATLTFAFGGRVGLALRRRVRIGAVPLLGIQFVLAIYGGYFGGAVGIMTLAVWSLLGTVDLAAYNPLKVLVVSACNSIATLCFVVSGAVWWPQTLAMLAAAAAGGYAGARLGRVMKPGLVRVVILTVSTAMTAIFFRRAF
jgi:uncharacterized protein